MKRIFLFLFFGLIFFKIGFSENEKQDRNIHPMKRRLSKVKQKKEVLQQTLFLKQREARFVTRDIQKVDIKLVEVEDKLEKTTTSLTQNRQEQTKLSIKLTATIDQLRKKELQVRARLRTMYTSTEPSPWLSLAHSRSLGDFAARKNMLQRIAMHDRGLFDDLKHLKNALNLQKSQQDHLVAEVSGLVKKQKNEQDTLEAHRSEKQNYLKDLKNQQKELRHQLDELDSESRSLTAKILQYMASLKGSGRQLSTYGGSLMRPVQGRLSSHFGWRVHPILKERRLHSGVDIAAAHGTPICAAAPGIVIESKYRRGYGNMVLIDHGGGLATLYGHCSRLLVLEGQKVEKGAVIANIGSTGLSTGPHLHFEVRKNGKPVDPMGYL